MLLQVTMNGLMLGPTYVLIAIGFSFIFGIARIFNFAHGEHLTGCEFRAENCIGQTVATGRATDLLPPKID